MCILYTVQTGSRLHLFIFLHLNPFSLFQLHTGHAFENCAETDMLCDVESAILGDVVSAMFCDVVSAMLCDVVSGHCEMINSPPPQSYFARSIKTIIHHRDNHNQWWDQGNCNNTN